MAVFDSNFIANPQQSQTNPLAMANEVTRLQAGQLANQNTARTMAANSAVSDAIQQATGEDGTIDYKKLHSLVSQNPAAAYNLTEATNANLAGEGSQISNATAQMAQVHDRLGIMGESLYGLAQKQNLTKADINEAIGNLVKQKILPMDMAMSGVGDVNQLPDNPDALRAYVVDHANRVASAQQQLEMNTQEFQQFTLPGGGMLLRSKKMTAPGGQGIQATFAPQLSAESLSQPVSIVGPDNRPTSLPLGEFLHRVGYGQGGQPTDNGDYSLPGVDTSSGAGAHQLTTGPSSQQQAAWTAATGRQQARETAALDVPNRIASLAQAGQQLSQLKDTDWAAGPKSRELANVFATLNTAGIHVDRNSVNSRAQLVKYLENAINVSATDAGFNGSDARLDAWKAGQPDPDKMPPQALKAAMAYVRSQAVGQALMSKYVHAQAAGDQTKVAQAEQDWANHYDANALYLATLPAGQRQKVLQKMGPKAAQQTRAHLSDMFQRGLIDPSDIAHYGQADAGE